MSGIILPKNEGKQNSNQDNKELQINYNATEEDEQKFFLMYHMNFQPSEVDNLDPERLKWIIARFMAQKSMEREAMERNRLLAQINPSLKP